jgi:hypothetical protein
MGSGEAVVVGSLQVQRCGAVVCSGAEAVAGAVGSAVKQQWQKWAQWSASLWSPADEWVPSSAQASGRCST